MPPKINVNVELENLRILVEQIKVDLEGKATVSKIDELLAEIRAKDNKIILLESKVAVLENTVDLLKGKCDDNEQYSRRTSVRINNIPLPNESNETADEVMVKVKEIIAETDAVIPDTFLDRAHRVGKPFVGDDGVRKQQVIVKFTTWHHRSVFYRKRSQLSTAKVYLDLTKNKFQLLKRSRVKVNGSNIVDFVFADINCALCAKLKNGRYQYFNTDEQLDRILANSV